MRGFLQTVGLALASESTERWIELAQRVLALGATRVRPAGAMTESYSGEPHDGEYALQRYARRISALPPSHLPPFFSASDFRPRAPVPTWPAQPPILMKDTFQALPIDEHQADLFFKSGGTSGTPKISVFSYTDYYTRNASCGRRPPRWRADPASDRVMNLFYAGGLYGVCQLFTILENLRAVQLPMAAHLETDFVAKMIVHHRVNTLFGMPSYLLRLFEDQREILVRYRGIEKIYYGGEHLSDARRKYFMDTFGVRLIRSAAYGSVDAGPLGFQCQHCLGGIHHLFSNIQHLEIVQSDADVPVPNGEVGRLLFTPLARHAQKIERYEIGDLGRWVPGPCPCGRSAPRFELLGRVGDVIRAGATFINYAKIEHVLAQELGFGGEFQLVIQAPTTHSGNERLTVRIAQIPEVPLPDPTRIRDLLIEHYNEIRVAVTEEDFLILTSKSAQLARWSISWQAASSGRSAT